MMQVSDGFSRPDIGGELTDKGVEYRHTHMYTAHAANRQNHACNGDDGKDADHHHLRDALFVPA